MAGAMVEVGVETIVEPSPAPLTMAGAIFAMPIHGEASSFPARSVDRPAFKGKPGDGTTIRSGLIKAAALSLSPVEAMATAGEIVEAERFSTAPLTMANAIIARFQMVRIPTQLL